jgi:hypothetical protein
MALDSTATPKANGLKTAIDIVIAPKEALEAIRVSPTWGWAYIISVVLAVAGFFIMLPAIQHGMTGDMAANPQLAQLSPEKQAEYIKTFVGFSPLFSIITPIAIIFFALLEAVLMLVCNALGHGEGSFKKLWAASVNIGIIYGLGQIVAAIVVVIRGPASFATASEIQRAIPSLALIAPGAGVKLVTFLATINPFTIWSVALVIMTMTVVARVPKVWAWVAGFLCFALPSLVAVAFAK